MKARHAKVLIRGRKAIQRGHDRGQLAVITALALPVVLGFLGLSYDIGWITLKRTHEQRAADAAALAGAAVIYDSGNPTLPVSGTTTAAATTAATSYASTNGYTSSETTVTSPLPTTSPHCSANTTRCDKYVQVTITKSRPTHFLRILGVNSTTIKAKAVAGVELASKPYALIVLDPSVCDAYYQSGSSNLTINDGSAIVNSTCGPTPGDAATQTGNSIVVADGTLDYNWQGTWDLSGSATASPAPGPVKYQVPDPLSAMPRPIPCAISSVAGCIPTSTDSAGTMASPNNLNINSSTTVHPGVYWGGLKISGSTGTVNFMPGMYVFAGGGTANGGFQYSGGQPLRVDPSATASQGVTFFNMRDNNATMANRKPCGQFKIAGNGGLNLRAPADTGAVGPFDDTNPVDGVQTMLWWQDDRTNATYGPACTADFDYDGGSDVAAGVLYLPKARLHVTGGGTMSGIQVIVNTFSYTGSAPFTINYTEYVKTKVPWLRLVE